MSIGLYVVMLEVICIKFSKFIPVFMIIICGFGFTNYMLLQYQTVFGSSFEALMRTFVMLFDLGYEERLYDPDNNGVMYYPVIYFVFVLAQIGMMIFVINLLIGKGIKHNTN